MAGFLPNPRDPRRQWHDLGGDLEGSYDGTRYVDVRHKSTRKRLLFISQGALEKVQALFQPAPLAR